LLIGEKVNVSETLADYLDRMLKQRNLKPKDVAERSGLSASYISRLLNGEKTNLTVETIGILVEALDLDPLELFTVAYGKPIAIRPGIDPLLLADTFQKLVANPKLIEMVQNASKLSPRYEKTILETVRVMALPGTRQKPKKKNKK
jgi:transcriptional regulator with XRE-family HTH domain